MGFDMSQGRLDVRRIWNWKNCVIKFNNLEEELKI
jgi:hypothetical protein